jgi:hypothetical protein
VQSEKSSVEPIAVGQSADGKSAVEQSVVGQNTWSRWKEATAYLNDDISRHETDLLSDPANLNLKLNT